MDFEFSEEQKMLRESVRDFAQKEVAPVVEEAEEKEHFPRHLMPKMGQLGYLCIYYPAKYGAAEMGKVSEGIMLEELAKVNSGICSVVMVQSGIGTSIVLNYGTEEQRQKYLVPAIKGQKIWAFGLTEPNAGSDAAGIQTKAVKHGNQWQLDGSKTFITNAPIADYVLISAYTDKSKGAGRGMSVFVVEKGTPGFTVAKKLSKLGNRCAETGELALDSVRIPAENLLGEEGRGFGYLMNSLSSGRVSHSFRSLGVAQAAFDASVKYANERSQFGQTIGKFQSIAFKLARMSVELEAARWLAYHAAWKYDAKLPYNKDASEAKLFASDVVAHITTEAMQIHGGYGYMMDSPVQRYYRDAKLFPITEGTSEIQQLVISREIGIK